MESSIKDMHWHTMTYRAPVWAERVKFIFCLPQLSDEHASASFERLSWLLKQRRINIFIARCGFVSKDWRRVFSNVCSLASVELRKKQLQYLWAFAESICEYFFYLCAFLHSNQWNWPRTIWPCVLFPFLPWPPFLALEFSNFAFRETNIWAATLAVSRNCKTLVFCEQWMWMERKLFMNLEMKFGILPT